jgi:hypothetical protein
VREPFRATPTATRNFRFQGHIRETVILTSECREGAIATFFNVLVSNDAADTSRDRTHDLPDAKQEHYH